MKHLGLALTRLVLLSFAIVVLALQVYIVTSLGFEPYIAAYAVLSCAVAFDFIGFVTTSVKPLPQIPGPLTSLIDLIFVVIFVIGGIGTFLAGGFDASEAEPADIPRKLTRQHLNDAQGTLLLISAVIRGYLCLWIPLIWRANRVEKREEAKKRRGLPERGTVIQPPAEELAWLK